MTDQRPPTVVGPKPGPLVSGGLKPDFSNVTNKPLPPPPPKVPGPKPKALPIAIGSAVLAAAMALIKPWEGGEVLKPYRDIIGVWTVCYGHADTSGVPVDRAKTYTPAECKALLATDIGVAYSHVQRCMPGDTPVSVQAATTSAALNIGPKVVCGSTLQRKAKAGDFAGACRELLRWNRAGGKVVKGLTNRRNAEFKVCMEDVK